MAVYRANVKFNMQNLGSGVNTFVFEIPGGTQPSNNEIRQAVKDWIEDLYDEIKTQMDNGCTFASGQIVRLASDGTTDALIGGFSADISGTADGSQLASTTAASMYARTDLAGIRGSKRIPGIFEGAQDNALFDNSLLVDLAFFAGKMLFNFFVTFILEGVPGVWSTREQAFVPFSDTAVVTNVPGTQVTRKPGRGS